MGEESEKYQSNKIFLQENFQRKGDKQSHMKDPQQSRGRGKGPQNAAAVPVRLKGSLGVEEQQEEPQGADSKP